MISFQSGDVAELRPQNPPEQVDKFINLMGWSDPDAILRITSTSSGRCAQTYYQHRTDKYGWGNRQIDHFRPIGHFKLHCEIY